MVLSRHACSRAARLARCAPRAQRVSLAVPARRATRFVCCARVVRRRARHPARCAPSAPRGFAVGDPAIESAPAVVQRAARPARSTVLRLALLNPFSSPFSALRAQRVARCCGLVQRDARRAVLRLPDPHPRSRRRTAVFLPTCSRSRRRTTVFLPTCCPIVPYYTLFYTLLTPF